MARRFIVAATGLSVAALLLAGCGSSGGSPATSGSTAKAGKVGVIIPSSANSARWEQADRRFLSETFTKAGVESDIQNANDDKAKFSSLCDQMINNGVSVLLVVNLDSDTGAACQKKAAAQGIKTIDYDRLTLGGSASYYVSFDNVAVGTAMGEGLVKCMKALGKPSGPVALVNGSPTDNNATLFKQGYETATKASGYTIGADQAIPEWDNTKAVTIFEQMYTQANGAFIGVDAANDGLAGAVISVLAKNGAAGKVPVSGQDATDEGLQRVLLGTQCMTVYKAVEKEAEAVAKLAIALSKGETPKVDGKTVDSKTGKDVPSVLLAPQAIFRENVKDVIADGYTTAARVCTTAALKTACTKYGVK